MPMNSSSVIGIDASRAFISGRSGTENYSYQIIQGIARESSPGEIVLFVRPGQKVLIDQPILSKVEVVEINRRRLWTQMGLARQTWLNPAQGVLFIPAHVIPFLKKMDLPVVVTVHDLRTEFLPQHQSWLQRLYLNRWVEWLRARLATHIIAVSQATKEDLITDLQIPDDKISVIHEGVDRLRFHLQLRDQREKIQELKDRLGLSGSYILFVGTIQPRKNLVRLIEAFSQILGDFPSYQLVLAGGKGWLCDEIYRTPGRLGIESRVRFVGYVSDSDLPWLYAGADVFAFPSLYEGFGLPILEALSCGIPVVTSTISSMPEVGGEHAYYVNPLDVNDIARGLKAGLTHGLIRGGLEEHLAQFSWRKAANSTLELLREVRDGNH